MLNEPTMDKLKALKLDAMALAWTEQQKSADIARISLREGIVLNGDFRALAASLAATHRKGRNRWQKSVTPSGHFSK